MSFKKRLTQQQEFEILKMVLDKFLWLGFVVMAYGMLVFFKQGWSGLTSALELIITGAVVLAIFLVLLVREYEIIK